MWPWFFNTFMKEEILLYILPGCDTVIYHIQKRCILSKSKTPHSDLDPHTNTQTLLTKPAWKKFWGCQICYWYIIKDSGRDDITKGTWNTRTLRAAEKLQELIHEMDRYRWNILGLCEMRWNSFGKTTTEEEHKVFFSGKEDKQEHGIGFLVTRTSWTLSWDVAQSPAGSSPSTWGQPLSTSK